MIRTKLTKPIAEGLKELQARIAAAKILPSKLDETINIATWNIREFGKKARTDAAIYYIAEILGQFDLISVVELRDDLTDLGKVLEILGPTWHVVYSDAIPDPGGNRERIAFVYDERAVTFNGLAAEATPPRAKSGDEYLSKVSWWRAPYLASFKSGNFDFVILTAHVRWGDKPESRKVELTLLADWVDAKRREKACEDRDILVTGDFNIPRVDDALFEAVTAKGLQIPNALRGFSGGTDLDKTKRYDQILHYPVYPESFSKDGGVLDFYQGKIEPLFKGMSKADFTYQLSDHLPLWIQVKTDIDGHKLDEIIQG